MSVLLSIHPTLSQFGEQNQVLRDYLHSSQETIVVTGTKRDPKKKKKVPWPNKTWKFHAAPQECIFFTFAHGKHLNLFHLKA